MREPKKVRTIAELIKSCRMLREHNEKLKGRIAELEARIVNARLAVEFLDGSVGSTIWRIKTDVQTALEQTNEQ